MEYLADDDVPEMLDDVGRTVIVGEDTVKAIVRQGDIPVSEGEGGGVTLSRDTIVTARTREISPAAGVLVTIGAETFRIREHRQIAGGVLTRLYCYEDA